MEVSELLSIGSNLTKQTCGCWYSSCASQLEPELDSKLMTKFVRLRLLLECSSGGGGGSAEAAAAAAAAEAVRKGWCAAEEEDGSAADEPPLLRVCCCSSEETGWCVE